MNARLGWVVAFVAVLSVASAAIADTPPSPWARASDPRVGDDWDVHVRVLALLAPESDENHRDERHRRAEAAQIWLEDAHAATSPDVRLRFDLGEVYEELEHYERAIEVLAPALAEFPTHPAATAAWIDLAYAYAYLDRSREEILAYDAYLSQSMNISGRATALGNRAEALMRLGQLDEAILGYKDAIAMSESLSGLKSLFAADVLGRWGLAVALDRSGDAVAGEREAARAAQLDPGIGGGQWPKGSIVGNGDPDIHVFFVPDYEKFYYLGLGMAEHAREAVDPRAAVILWQRTEALWSQYVAGAEAWNARHKDRPDRWLSLAQVHVARAQKQRVAAEKRKQAR